MLLKDFSFSQLEPEISLKLGGTDGVQTEDSGITLRTCNNPSQWSCSHYGQDGYSCNRPSQASCSKYRQRSEQKPIKVAA